jgi:hypothetical protein
MEYTVEIVSGGMIYVYSLVTMYSVIIKCITSTV